MYVTIILKTNPSTTLFKEHQRTTKEPEYAGPQFWRKGKDTEKAPSLPSLISPGLSTLFGGMERKRQSRKSQVDWQGSPPSSKDSGKGSEEERKARKKRNSANNFTQEIFTDTFEKQNSSSGRLTS